MRRSLRTSLAAVVGAVVLAAAPSASQVNPGARVRVWVDSPPPPRTIVGTANTLTRDTLVLASNGTTVQRIPTSAIGRLDVSTGRGVVASHVVIGTLGGALLGGVIGGVTSSCRTGQWLCFQGLAIAGGMLVGGAAGAITGALIKGEHWKTVPLARLAVFPAPGHGVGMAVRVEF